MKNRFTLRKEFSAGGRVPRGWRMAWFEPRRRVGVYFPSPLHWFARIAREVCHRLRAARRAESAERAEISELQRAHGERVRLAEEYARGYMAGWRECFDTCMAAVEDELAQSQDVWEIGALLTESAASGKQN
jgi:hypothetical protein